MKTYLEDINKIKKNEDSKMLIDNQNNVYEIWTLKQQIKTRR